MWMGLLLSTALAAGWAVDAETDQRPRPPAPWQVRAAPTRAQPRRPAKVAAALASSTLVEKGRAPDRYRPPRAVDGKLSTCWCEGKPGHGEGEWLELELDRPARAKAVRVYPGCGDNDRTWLANNRIADLEITAGDETKRAALADERRLQDVGFASSAPVAALRLTIRAVQPWAEGRTPKYDDTCIGEVELDLE